VILDSNGVVCRSKSRGSSHLSIYQRYTVLPSQLNATNYVCVTLQETLTDDACHMRKCRAPDSSTIWRILLTTGHQCMWKVY